MTPDPYQTMEYVRRVQNAVEPDREFEHGLSDELDRLAWEIDQLGEGAGGTAHYAALTYGVMQVRRVARKRSCDAIAERAYELFVRLVGPTEPERGCPGHGDDEDCEDDPQNPCESCRNYYDNRRT